MSPKSVIQSLNKPKNLPFEDALKSHGQSQVNYESDFWELEYQTRRYLAGLDDSGLLARHVCILKNLEYFASPESDFIPIHSFRSSWFWYRKEHQTRFEMHLRGLFSEVCTSSSLAQNVCESLISLPAPSASHASGGKLYRYGGLNRLEQLQASGGLRMWHAEFYSKLEKDLARQDNEMAKDRYLNGALTVITGADGVRIPTVGDVCISHSGPEYYLLCMSSSLDLKLFDDFNVHHCAVIENVDDFAMKLEHAALAAMPGFLFHHNPVEYFDPYEAVPRQHLSHTISKDFKYAYQKEYRFLLMSNNQTTSGREYLDLELGPMQSEVTFLERNDCLPRRAVGL